MGDGGALQAGICGTEFALSVYKELWGLEFLFSGCLVFNKTYTLHTVPLVHEHPILNSLSPRTSDWLYLLPSKSPSFWGENAISGRCDLCSDTVTVLKGRKYGYKFRKAQQVSTVSSITDHYTHIRLITPR